LPCSDKVPESTSTHLNQTSSKAIAHGGTHIQTSITKTGEGNIDCITLVSTQIFEDIQNLKIFKFYLIRKIPFGSLSNI
jgi:hypothetical protein